MPLITHVKSFKDLSDANTYCGELRECKKNIEYGFDTCVVMNELW